VILCPADQAKKLAKKQAVKILASTAASDTIALHSRADLAALESTAKAAAKAYQVAGKSAKDIQVCEVHDCFTIAEIIVTEALGFFEKGKGGGAVQAGETAIGGRIPVNTSGGLKSKGHPVGATGVAQAVEIVEQLRGESGPRQVKGARLGMTQNMGGTGASAVVHILEAM
jgi:acetyl-CoA C-acetyltransferase